MSTLSIRALARVQPAPNRTAPGRRLGAALRCAAIVTTLAGASSAMAQSPLGSAQQFGVLGASAVTNTGASVIKGSLGVFPGTSITGAGTITMVGGGIHDADAVAQQAQTDAMTAFVNFGMLTPTSNLTGQNLGGMTLSPGVYLFSSSAQLTGQLFLDFMGNANALFVFQIGSTLTTASNSSVTVLNGAPGGGVYWDVGSSATLGTNTAFEGNILAQASITLNTGATIICGRAIALTGAVTMQGNVVSNDCTNGGNFNTGVNDFGSGGFSGVPGAVSTPEPTSLALLIVPCLAVLIAFARKSRSSASIAAL